MISTVHGAASTDRAEADVLPASIEATRHSSDDLTRRVADVLRPLRVA